MTKLPFTGLRILDFGWIYAVPHATAWMASLGAEVIKVEGVQMPEIGRYMGTTDGKSGPNLAPFFNSINFSKRSIGVDLTTNGGLEVIRRLVKECDVVTENFAAGTMQKFGLDYDNLRQIKYDLIMLSCSPLGQDGPYGPGAVGFGPNAMAVSGLLHLTGYPGGGPGVIGGSWPDFMMGMSIMFAVLAALHYRERTGEGQYIDLSIAELCTSIAPEGMMDYFLNGRVRGPIGNRDLELAPHGSFPTSEKDGWIAIAVTSNEEFARLCEALGAETMAAEPRYRTMKSRLENVDALEAALRMHTRRFPRDHLVQMLRARGVAAGPLYDAKQLVDDPVFRASPMAAEVIHKEAGKRLIGGFPVSFSDLEPQLRGAPTLYQDTDSILGDLLGLSIQEIERLRADKAIA
ncbi:MAG: CaiB/BaiF CoA transferase family protein [Candidatus Binataceae bacterium]